ncbi:MAG: dipeptidase [Gemmatimonadota bacterium]
MKRWIIRSIVAAVLVAAVGFFVALAPVADRVQNRLLRAPHEPVPDSVAAFHRQLVIVDLHADALLWPRDLLARANHGHVDVPRLIEGNVALQVFGVVTKSPPGLNYQRNEASRDQLTFLVAASRWPIATWSNLLARALYQATSLRDLEARSDGKLPIIRTAGDLDGYLARRAANRAQTAGLLAMEGLHALAGNLIRIDTLYDAGFRMMGLTHFFDNEVGGSSAGVAKGGLTDFGRAVVRRLEERHIIIDLAHASPATVDDVLSMATRPVVVSHTGLAGTCPGPRNLTDDQVRRIAANGGVIGIGYWETAVCELSPQAIAKAIRYAVGLAGVDHVGLGSDFDGATTTAFDISEVDRITEVLLSNGFSQDEVARLMGGNALRLLREGLPAQ